MAFVYELPPAREPVWLVPAPTFVAPKKGKTRRVKEIQAVAPRISPERQAEIDAYYWDLVDDILERRAAAA